MCISIDLEKESVSRTKRPRRCRSVQFHRSICAVSPVSFPTCVSWSSGTTAWYAFQKSEKQCPWRYSPGMLSHSLWHVFSLRSPTARATTCRVFLQRAIHTHTLFTFLNTNDHNSSNSRTVASGSSGSGATNVSPCYVLHQMSLLVLAYYFAPDMILWFLHDVPPCNHWTQDFHDFVSYMICSDIFAFHSMHDRYTLNLYFHSIGSK